MGFSNPHPTPCMPRHRNLEISSGDVVPSRMNPPTNPTGSKGTAHLFFKTRLCAKFLEGSCKNDHNCTFAHGVDDLRHPPPNWKDLICGGGSRSWNGGYEKMKICTRFYNGVECPYGQRCNFIHEHPNKNIVDSELHVPSDPIKADFSDIQVNCSMVHVIDPSPSIDIGAQTKVVGEDKKFPRWRPNKKINTIYGDWLDDLTPLHASPNEEN